MKTLTSILALGIIFLNGCASNADSWNTWIHTDIAQRVALQRQTMERFRSIVFKKVDLQNVKLSEAIAYLNENQQSDGKRRIKFFVPSQLFDDFSSDPAREIATFLETHVSAKGENVDLGEVLHQLLNLSREPTQYYIANDEIYIFPDKYSREFTMYFKRNTIFQNGLDDMTCQTMLKFINEEFLSGDFHIDLKAANETEKAKLLTHVIKQSYGNDPSLRDAIMLLKNQLNLICYVDDKGNITLEPKNEPPRQP